MTFRPILHSALPACLLLCIISLIPLAGCGQPGGSGGVQPGGAVVDEKAEEANRAAEAAYAAEAKAKKKR